MVAKERNTPPSNDDIAKRVYLMHATGHPASEIDALLRIGNSREIIVYEWAQDRLRKPSLVGGDWS